MPVGNWRPVSEYIPEMGRVLVWISWTEYDRATRSPQKTGTFDTAYQLMITDGKPCWVDADDSTPTEVAGRRVTYFMHPASPTTGPKDDQ